MSSRPPYCGLPRRSRALTTFASAEPFSSVFVYGDSLSDLGNIYKVTGGANPLSPPY
jgi:outer membrane lipase/esterase